MVDRVLNFTWSVEVPFNGSNMSAIQPSNPNCSLLLVRGFDNRFSFSVGQGVVGNYQFAPGNDCFYNITTATFNETVFTDKMMVRLL